MTLKPLQPFGLQVDAIESLSNLQPDLVNEWIDSHRLVVLRGLPVHSDEQLLDFCGKLGQVLEWEFGAFNELKIDPDTKNYLYTNRRVPMHWDGAFLGRIPHLIFFYCQSSSAETDTGGETVFCDSIDLVAKLSPAEREHLDPIAVTYTTDKVAHYGGSFTSPLIVPHPKFGVDTLRYAEPVTDLNPVQLQIPGLSDDEKETLLFKMEQRLYDSSRCYTHAWRTNDILIADNHALLHGRNAFQASVHRHLRRVNIL